MSSSQFRNEQHFLSVRPALIPLSNIPHKLLLQSVTARPARSGALGSQKRSAAVDSRASSWTPLAPGSNPTSVSFSFLMENRTSSGSLPGSLSAIEIMHVKPLSPVSNAYQTLGKQEELELILLPWKPLKGPWMGWQTAGCRPPGSLPPEWVRHPNKVRGLGPLASLAHSPASPLADSSCCIPGPPHPGTPPWEVQAGPLPQTAVLTGQPWAPRGASTPLK